jgi:hypothetical protein
MVLKNNRFACIAVNIFVHALLASMLMLISQLDMYAQGIEPFEDETIDILGPKEFCKPGIADKSKGAGLYLEWRAVRPQDFIVTETGAEAEQVRDRWRAGIKVPIVRRSNLQVVLGYSYRNEEFAFSSTTSDFEDSFIGLIDDRTLLSNQFNINIVKPTNNINYLIGRFGMRYRGDYGNFISVSSTFLSYEFAAGFGRKISQDTEWSIILAGDIDKSGLRMLPFFIYHQNITEKFGVELSLPSKMRWRYNLRPGTLLLFDTEYKLTSYILDNTQAQELNLYNPMIHGGSHLAFRHAEVEISFNVQKHIFSWFWTSAKIGYQISRNSKFEVANTRDELFRINLGNAPVLEFELFIYPSPYCKKDFIKTTRI